MRKNLLVGVVMLILTASAVNAGNVTIFFDDFEDGDVSDWSVHPEVETFEITNDSISGNYSLNIMSQYNKGRYAYKGMTDSVTLGDAFNVYLKNEGNRADNSFSFQMGDISMNNTFWTRCSASDSQIEVQIGGSEGPTTYRSMSTDCGATTEWTYAFDSGLLEIYANSTLIGNVTISNTSLTVDRMFVGQQYGTYFSGDTFEHFDDVTVVKFVSDPEPELDPFVNITGDFMTGDLLINSFINLSATDGSIRAIGDFIIGSLITIDASTGDITTSGDVTASSFIGDGSQLTGLKGIVMVGTGNGGIISDKWLGRWNHCDLVAAIDCEMIAPFDMTLTEIRCKSEGATSGDAAEYRIYKQGAGTNLVCSLADTESCTGSGNIVVSEGQVFSVYMNETAGSISGHQECTLVYLD